MNIPEMLRMLGERVGSNATVKNVYGDPITAGGRTVVPVARVSYGFGGGGGGARPGEEAQNGGGGARLTAQPRGALEITAAGTRFIDFPRTSVRLCLAVSIGFAIGVAIGSRSARKN